MLGPDHPKTRKWQQDLFFLINAPAVQYLVQQQAAQKKAAAAAASSTSATKLALPAAEPDAAANPQEWWLRNMANGAAASAEGGGPDFWQRNLGSADGDGDGDALAFMQQMFAETAHFTPNDGGGGANGGGPNLGYANDWVAKVFEAPAGDAGGVVDEKMGDALDWLQSTFTARARPAGGGGGGGGGEVHAAAGEALDWLQNSFTARGTTGDSLSRSLNLNATRRTDAPGNPWAFTPRPNAPAEQASATRASDDAVLAAAMSAVLSTPRGDVGGPSVVPDAVLGHGMSKMFKRQVL